MSGQVIVMLDIQLQIFKTVVEAQSFSRAAQQLHMTQSSVSQQIQNLEAYYGVKLFDRLHRRIATTEAGAALYPFALAMEKLCEEAHKTMQGITGVISGRLHIGASLTVGEYLMPKILVAFSRLYPQVDVAMDIYNTEQITDMVVEGRINLGFVEGPFKASDIILSQLSGGDELVVVAPADFDSGEGSIPVADLLSERWVMREPNSGTRHIFEQYIEGRGVDPAALNIVMELGSTQAIKEAVKAGLGIAAISRLTVDDEIERGELTVVPLAEGSIRRHFTMLRHREKFRTTAVERFSEFVLHMVNE